MKKRFGVALALLVAFTVVVVAGDGKKYGKDLTIKEKTSIAEIMKNPEKFEGKRVMVEGEIDDVCQMMGCWIRISDKTTKESMLFKVEDGVIEFPKDGKGKRVRAEGVVSVKTYTKEELIKKGKHEAEEQGKEFDSSSITGPKVEVQIDGEAAVIEE